MKPDLELFNVVNTLKGVISGSVLFMSIVLPFGLIPQLILFVFGFAIFLNCVMLYDEDIHVFSTFVGMAAGILLTIYMITVRMELLWLLLMIILTAFVYFFQGITGAISRSAKRLPKVKKGGIFH